MVEYWENPETGRWHFIVAGENGEVQAKSEGYEGRGNANRGAADLARSVLRAVAEGEIDMQLKT